MCASSSTFRIKILSAKTVKISSVAGNLNDRDGPCGLISLIVLEEAHTLYQEKKAGALTSPPDLGGSGGMLLLMKGEHSNSEIVR